MDRHSLFRLTLAGLAAARFPKWAPGAADLRGMVLTLHHVRPERAGEFAPNAHLSITPDFLDHLLAALKLDGWRFTPLEELVAGRQRGNALAVTLDDGFRDNATHALPVFRRHDVPFTIFVCPGFCDRTAEIWWEALERIIAAAGQVRLDDEPGTPVSPSRTAAEKRRAFSAWSEWLTVATDEARQRIAIRKLAAAYDIDLAALAAELVMDWAEIRTIAAEPLCTIGAHTLTHPALARLDAADAFAEMSGSADRLAAELGRRPRVIAFPYGYPAAAGRREALLAEQAGFAASFTTQPGYIGAERGNQALPRISVNGGFQNVAMLEVLLTPALWRLQKRLRRGR